MNTICLLLVDSHELMRTTLKFFLESQAGFQVVAQAGDAAEAIEQVRKTFPDVIVLDVTPSGMDVGATIREAKAVSPESQILAITAQSDPQCFISALVSGATGYLTRQAATEELIGAIRAVAQGHVYLQPSLARWLLDDYCRLLGTIQPSVEKTPESKSLVEPLETTILSEREQQVLKQVAQGLTNPQIAEQLHISPKTVARHRERVMKKLKVHSSVELVKIALRSGLIEL
jgi:two-component system response regulator NreC